MLHFFQKKSKYLIKKNLAKDKNGVIQGIYVSRRDAANWSKILKGPFVSSFSKFGQILFAVENTKEVNELIFSVDSGNNWETFKFAKKPYLVKQITKSNLNDVSTVTSKLLERFLLLTIDPITREQVIFTIDIAQQTKFSPLHLDDLHDESYTMDCLEKCISTINQVKKVF